MILIGQFDSPFVRRVGVALTLYGVAFDHRPWSVFGDAEKIRAYNPLTRVPTLVLDDGTVLTESHLILDYIDSLAPAGKGLAPRTEPDRHRVLRVAALAMGVCDKAVSLFYEKRLHAEASDIWVKRCVAQIHDTLALLERERAGAATPFWSGEAPDHADIAITVMLRFVTEAHPGLVQAETVTGLAAIAARLEATEAFRTIRQVFIPPA